MSYLVKLEVEIDASNDNVARRHADLLFEALQNEYYVEAFSMTPPAEGRIKDPDFHQGV